MSYQPVNRMHFIDPVQDITVDAKQVLVLRTPNGYNDELLDTIVDVKRERHFDAYQIWYVTTAGDYVQGAPINPPLSRHVLGIVRDDLFVVGQPAALTSEPAPGLRINNAHRSDRLTIGGSSMLMHQQVQQWVKAAPWAVRLMPLPTDGVGSSSAKLRLAEALYEKRKVQAQVILHMVMRDEEDDLETLTETHDLPTPTFGAMVRASAFLPVPDQLSEDALAHVRNVLDRPNEAVIPSHKAFARVDMSFMYQGDAGNKDEVKAFPPVSISRRATDVMQVANVLVSNPKLTPALRNLSS